MKSILLHVGGDRGFEARLQAALDLARSFEGRITCLQSINVEFYAPGDFYGTAAATVVPMVKEAADDLAESITKQLENEDVSWEWIRMDGPAQLHLLQHSALHDLIIIGEHDAGELYGPSRMAGELALNARSPILVVPDEAKSLDVNAPVLVAWNGSPEASSALRAALPFLAKAGQVYLASVVEEDEQDRLDFPAVNGLQYLALYGIDAELIEFPKDDRKVVEVLVSAAEIRECSMMVMGAYGRSRLSEMLLGGVTRAALTGPSLPILLSH